ncbi:MAG: hypothetical protein ACR2PH_11225 [Desulfobulbia bacterium]
MFSGKIHRTIASTHGIRGYYIAELTLSVLLIAAAAVLAFPTYQDLQLNQDLADESYSITQMYSHEEPDELSTSGFAVNQQDELVAGQDDQNIDLVVGMESEEHRLKISASE